MEEAKIENKNRKKLVKYEMVKMLIIFGLEKPPDSKQTCMKQELSGQNKAKN